MSKHIYLISGMGADERMFRHLRFPDEYTVHYLPWLDPHPNEPYVDYAARMAQGITTEGEVTLMGLSFGGMLSLEIAQQRPIAKNILISTIKHTRERPAYFNWVRRLKLNHLPDQLIFGKRYLVVKHYMGPKSPEEEQLLRDYLKKQDQNYMRWAINTVIGWENEFIPNSLVHIHGDSDLTFPLKTVQPTHVIKGGSHFMIMNHAAEINRILSEEL